MNIQTIERQPVDLSEMLRKAIGAERAAIVRYLRANPNMTTAQAAESIQHAYHVRLDPVVGVDPRD